MPSIRTKNRKDGTSSYEVRIHRAGYPDISKSFRSLAEARKWANDTEARIDKGERVSRKAEKTSLAEVFDVYVAEHHNPPKEGEERGPQHREMSGSEILRVRALRHDLGEFAVASFQREHVLKYIRKLLETKIPPPHNRKKFHPLFKGADRDNKTYAPSSVRKLYYTLKKCLEWHALTEKYHLDPHLFEKVGVPPGWETERERRLEPGEEQRIIEATERGYTNQQEWRCLISFALETAMRSQEMLKARWQDLNFDGRTLNIPKEHVKTKTFRQIPLSKKAVESLRTMEKFKKANEPRIFWQWNTTAVLGAAFKRLTKRAGVDDFHIHDLRHEATSRLFEKGKLSDMEIMKITGHTQYSTLARYVKYRTSNLADKMD